MCIVYIHTHTCFLHLFLYIFQGLRTLELCVDNLQPDFLYEHIQPVRAELMQVRTYVRVYSPQTVHSTQYSHVYMSRGFTCVCLKFSITLQKRTSNEGHIHTCTVLLRTAHTYNQMNTDVLYVPYIFSSYCAHCIHTYIHTYVRTSLPLSTIFFTHFLSSPLPPWPLFPPSPCSLPPVSHLPLPSLCLPSLSLPSPSPLPLPPTPLPLSLSPPSPSYLLLPSLSLPSPLPLSLSFPSPLLPSLSLPPPPPPIVTVADAA